MCCKWKMMAFLWEVFQRGEEVLEGPNIASALNGLYWGTFCPKAFLLYSRMCQSCAQRWQIDFDLWRDFSAFPDWWCHPLVNKWGCFNGLPVAATYWISSLVSIFQELCSKISTTTLMSVASQVPGRCSAAKLRLLHTVIWTLSW